MVNHSAAPTWPDVCAVLARWQQANLPGTLTVEVALKLATGGVLPMPFVVAPLAAPAPIAAPAPLPAEDLPFVPTPFQKAILQALDGKALHARALGAAVGDTGRLYKPHGLQELRERGLVELHERLGFWRPDAPPPQLQQDTPEDTPEE